MRSVRATDGGRSSTTTDPSRSMSRIEITSLKEADGAVARSGDLYQSESVERHPEEHRLCRALALEHVPARRDVGQNRTHKDLRRHRNRRFHRTMIAG